MVGSLFAGCSETPGEIKIIDGKQFKEYNGMASAKANEWRTKLGEIYSPEGISALVPCKGSVKPILDVIKGNIQSGFSYVGARNINELRANSEFVQQTNASQRESSTHILDRGGTLLNELK